MSQIYQIKISLIDFEPTIWRRVLIASDAYLGELHMLIQASMGWENYHLHQFIKDKTFYLSELDDFFSAGREVDYEAEEIKVLDLLPRVNSKLIYEYDFGDSWEHELVVEKKLDIAPVVPICLEGKMACPPEDSGGVWGYTQKLEVLNDPKHEDYKDLLEWMGLEFDARKFDLKEANERISWYFPT